MKQKVECKVNFTLTIFVNRNPILYFGGAMAKACTSNPQWRQLYSLDLNKQFVARKILMGTP